MTFYVYRGVNHDLGEVYHGVSIEPERRVDGSHCRGGTVALSHWECGVDRIHWRIVSRHRSQSTASLIAHDHEVIYRHRSGYRNIRTRGI